VVISPASAAIVIGGAIQLTATPTTRSATDTTTPGDPVRGGPVTWSSDNPSVALVSSAGLVTAVGSGQATIAATIDGVRGNATILVVPPTSLDVDGVWDWTEQIVGSSYTCNDTGSYNFTQVGVTFGGQSRQVGGCRAPGDNVRTDPVSAGVISGTDITFAVGGGVCHYAAHASGTPASSLSGTVTCNDGAAGTWQATRQHPVASVAIAPASFAELPGFTRSIKALVSDAQGNRLFFRAVTWTSDDPSVASIVVTTADSNRLTTVAPGVATITASAGGKSGTSAVTVLVPIASVTVTPSPDTLDPGASLQLTATARDAGGNTLTDRTVFWSSDNGTVATVSSTGLVTGVAAGATNVHAGADGVMGTAAITVTGTPLSMAGEWTFDKQYTYCDAFSGCDYTGCESAGSMVLTQSGFGFSGTLVQESTCLGVPAPGPVTGGSVSGRAVAFTSGNCQFETVMTVAGDSLTGSASCSDYPDGNVVFHAVRDGPAVALAVEPAALDLLVGGTGQLRAIITDSAGHRLYDQAITWSSDNSAVATVSDSGVVTAVGSGSATITAVSDGLSRTTAVAVTTVSLASLFAGDATTCGLTAAGAAYCWGYNGGGQLGVGDYANRSVPSAVGGGTTFGSIAIGVLHACGLTGSGAVYCWGHNGNGQLGDGSGTDRLLPGPVAGGLTFTALTSGTYHTCGLTSSGAAYCWGMNGDGRLGDGTVMDRSSPTLVAGGLTFALVTAGQSHTCALTTSGAAYCWGGNYLGQLGTGDLTSRSTPTLVAGGLVFAALYAGGDHTCAITAGGSAYCWGDNGNGQIGDGTIQGRLMPAPVSGGLTFALIAPGLGHTCGLTTGGIAYCWGLNSGGEVGDGSNANTSVPVPVTGALTFTSVIAGSAHSCGLTTSGVAYCWGYNSYGQMGNASTANSAIPVKVVGQP
jgi:alpha-tubulin suppressor-like RCC1 family protein